MNNWTWAAFFFLLSYETLIRLMMYHLLIDYSYYDNFLRVDQLNVY